MSASTEMRQGGSSRAWVVFTTLAAGAIFLQSVTAGRMLTGDDWARTAHRATGGLSVLATLLAGLLALTVLRGRVGGRRLGTTLVGLAVSLFVQERLGAAAADGEDTLWIHIPFGVAIIGLATYANVLARRLRPPSGGRQLPYPGTTSPDS